ncbi:MAG TPA: hypothetical protein VFI65_07570 [Streptosporangiaceae bacterium]|nr:hypothetical protein [Streptosporangiaceae bacterium]
MSITPAGSNRAGGHTSPDSPTISTVNARCGVPSAPSGVPGIAMM